MIPAENLKKRAPARRPKPRRPKSLFHFLRWRGGLRPDPNVLYLMDSRRRSLVHKSGLSLDQARQECIGEGFLQNNECREHEPSINDLLDLIAAEAAGRKQYRIHEALDAYEHEAGVGLNDPIIDRASLSLTAQQKLNAAIRQHANKLDIEVAARVRAGMTHAEAEKKRPEREGDNRQFSRLFNFVMEHDPHLIALCEEFPNMPMRILGRVLRRVWL